MATKTTSVYVFWKNNLLLIQRSQHDENLPLYWEAPAGHTDIYVPSNYDTDTARQEAARELREETGIIINPKRLNFLDMYSNDKHLSYFLDLSSMEIPPEIKLSHEHTAYAWINPMQDTLPFLLRPEVFSFIKDMNNER